MSTPADFDGFRSQRGHSVQSDLDLEARISRQNAFHHARQDRVLSVESMSSIAENTLRDAEETIRDTMGSFASMFQTEGKQEESECPSRNW
jgi:hypothetical protein